MDENTHHSPLDMFCAVHEAGHAVVAAFSGIYWPDVLTIVPLIDKSAASAQTWPIRPEVRESLSEWHRGILDMMLALGGPSAEALFYPSLQDVAGLHEGDSAGDDWPRAESIATRIAHRGWPLGRVLALAWRWSQEAILEPAALETLKQCARALVAERTITPCVVWPIFAPIDALAFRDSRWRRRFCRTHAEIATVAMGTDNPWLQVARLWDRDTQRAMA